MVAYCGKRKRGRPMKVHTNWFCQGFKPNIRVANFGNAMQKAMLSDSRNVVPGDVPWSKLGEYGNNVKLQHGGKPFAIVNFLVTVSKPTFVKEPTYPFLTYSMSSLTEKRTEYGQSK